MPPMARTSDVLPAPFEPTTAIRLPLGTRSHSVEGARLAVADFEVVDLEQRRHASFAFLPR